MNKRRLRAGLSAALAAAVMTAGQRASAGDFELWLPIEVRVPVVSNATPSWPRVDWRVALEARFAPRFNGAEQIFLRTGPIVYVTPWMFVAAHGSLLADALSTTAGMPTRMEEEARAELEPNFFGRIGPFTIANRLRFEYRWRQTYQRVRIRNQLRINLAPQGWRVLPFVQDEVLLDTWDSRIPADGTLPAGVAPTPGINQNRLMFGVGFQVASNIRIDVGMLVRARQQPGMADWAVDMGPWLQLFMDVPKPPTPAVPGANAPVNAAASAQPSAGASSAVTSPAPSGNGATDGSIDAAPAAVPSASDPAAVPATTPSSSATN